MIECVFQVLKSEIDLRLVDWVYLKLGIVRDTNASKFCVVEKWLSFLSFSWLWCDCRVEWEVVDGRVVDAVLLPSLLTYFVVSVENLEVVGGSDFFWLTEDDTLSADVVVVESSALHHFNLAWCHGRGPLGPGCHHGHLLLPVDVSDCNSACHWVVVDWDVELRGSLSAVVSRAVIDHSWLHLEAVGVSEEDILLIDVGSLENHNHLLSLVRVWNGSNHNFPFYQWQIPIDPSLGKGSLICFRVTVLNGNLGYDRGDLEVNALHLAVSERLVSCRFEDAGTTSGALVALVAGIVS